MPIDALVIHKRRFRTQSGTKGRPRPRAHGDIDVLEDLAWGDAADAVRRLDQVITGLARMFATEGVDEREGLSELFCLDQEAGAIDVPFCRRFPHVPSPLGGGKSKFVIACWLKSRLRVRRIYSGEEMRSIT